MQNTRRFVSLCLFLVLSCSSSDVVDSQAQDLAGQDVPPGALDVVEDVPPAALDVGKDLGDPADQNVEPIACQSDDECPGMVCDPATSLCVECLKDADCPTDEVKCFGAPICVDNSCQADPDAVAVECDSSMDTTCLANICDPETGLCSYIPVNQGEACDDDNPCTVDEFCAGPVCQGGVAVDCDDADPCTVDYCDQVGCQNVPIGACCLSDEECDDGQMCTLDVCGEDHQCSHSPDPDCCLLQTDCDDNDPCTIDSCEYYQCVYSQNFECCNNGTLDYGEDCDAAMTFGWIPRGCHPYTCHWACPEGTVNLPIYSGVVVSSWCILPDLLPNCDDIEVHPTLSLCPEYGLVTSNQSNNDGVWFHKQGLTDEQWEDVIEALGLSVGGYHDDLDDGVYCHVATGQCLIPLGNGYVNFDKNHLCPAVGYSQLLLCRTDITDPFAD